MAVLKIQATEVLIALICFSKLLKCMKRRIVHLEKVIMK